jgi:hypothetical protein
MVTISTSGVLFWVVSQFEFFTPTVTIEKIQTDPLPILGLIDLREWRNGRRNRLRTCRGHTRGGSNPSSRTTPKRSTNQVQIESSA